MCLSLKKRYVPCNSMRDRTLVQESCAREDRREGFLVEKEVGDIK